MRRPPDADPAWAWFFDIDGTLVEIAATPSSVVVHDDLPHLIAKLNSMSGGAVSLITGRALSDVDEILPLPGVNVAGQHGFEVRTASGELNTLDAAVDFESIAEELAPITEKHRGLIVEHKGSSIALHYRRAPRLAGYAHRLMRELATRHGPGIVIQKGKKVVELKPEGADKGEAIRSLMRRAPFMGRRPVFIGDDITDESGFNVINELGGISVKVGPGATQARFRLSGVGDVRSWLEQGISGRRERSHGAA